MDTISLSRSRYVPCAATARNELLQRSLRRSAQRDARAQIARWRENVLDLDIAVDDRRRDLEAAMVSLREAIRDRDRAAAHLAQLIDYAELASCLD